MNDTDNVKEELKKEESSLFVAIFRDDSENEILTIIDRDPSAARKRDINGNYSLHEACLYNGRELRVLVILKLLDLFPQAAQEKCRYIQRYGLRYDDYVDHYLLHIACRKLCDDVILKLINVYPDAAQMNNKARDIDYPLHIALYHNRSDRVIMKLLDAYPEAAASKCERPWLGRGDMYPLHYACKNGLSVQVIRKLLEIYPRALHKQSTCDWRNGYPLGWAVECKQISIDVVKLLVTTDPSILLHVNDRGDTYLHDACSWNRADIVEFLLQFPNLPINARNERGCTALHFAFRNDWKEKEALVALLLDNPDVDVNAVDDRGESVLHQIIPGHKFNFIHLLLDHPCIIIDQKDCKNQTPLDLINKQISERTNEDDDNDYKKSVLHRFMEARQLLQDFPTKRKSQSFEYFYQNIEDWSSPKRMKM